MKTMFRAFAGLLFAVAGFAPAAVAVAALGTPKSEPILEIAGRIAPRNGWRAIDEIFEVLRPTEIEVSSQATKCQ